MRKAGITQIVVSPYDGLMNDDAKQTIAYLNAD